MNQRNKGLWIFLDTFLLVLTFYFLFNFFNISIGDNNENINISTPTPLAIPKLTYTVLHPLNSYDVILTSGIFGDFLPKKTPTPSPTPKKVKREKVETEPDFTGYIVKGTIVGKNTNSYVIIEDDSGKEKIYKKGDKIEEFEITDIQKEKVVLRKGNKIVTLKFREEERF